jgi:hypothetical protein
MQPLINRSADLSRRALLHVGCSSFLGMGLPALWAGQEQSRTVRPASSRPAQAKSVILILLTGGASHLDTFDMKPEAPVENRGPFQQIATRTNGLQVCEFLPR